MLKILLMMSLVSSTFMIAQTRLVNNKDHYLAILDGKDSKTLYKALNIKPQVSGPSFIKRMGPTDLLVEISCTLKNKTYSCFAMLKLYNLKESEEQHKVLEFYLAADVAQDLVDSWYDQLNIPNEDFGNGHLFKEFSASDGAMYFNCRVSPSSPKQCRLGIILD